MVGKYITSAQTEWRHMVHKYLIEDQKIEPVVTLIANDNWLEFTIRYVVDYKRRRGTKDELFTRILEEIDKSGGRVGIASTTIHLVETPPLDVNIRRQQ